MVVSNVRYNGQGKWFVDPLNLTVRLGVFGRRKDMLDLPLSHFLSHEIGGKCRALIAD